MLYGGRWDESVWVYVARGNDSLYTYKLPAHFDLEWDKQTLLGQTRVLFLGSLSFRLGKDSGAISPNTIFVQMTKHRAEGGVERRAKVGPRSRQRGD